MLIFLYESILLIPILISQNLENLENFDTFCTLRSCLGNSTLFHIRKEKFLFFCHLCGTLFTTLYSPISSSPIITICAYNSSNELGIRRSYIEEIGAISNAENIEQSQTCLLYFFVSVSPYTGKLITHAYIQYSLFP
jgi:hypothetical protein